MLDNKTVAVVIPCYNEQTQIERVLTTLPPFVDLAIVVDDASKDATVELVRKHIASQGEPVRTILLERKTNAGVGAAIVDGYREAARRRMDVTAVMAGDAQMDPDELVTLAGPVARGETDYAKGNRLFYRGAWETIPRHRYLGNAFLSMLTKIASGYRSCFSRAAWNSRIAGKLGTDAFHCRGLDENIWNVFAPNSAALSADLSSAPAIDVCNPIRTIHP